MATTDKGAHLLTLDGPKIVIGPGVARYPYLVTPQSGRAGWRERYSVDLTLAHEDADPFVARLEEWLTESRPELESCLERGKELNVHTHPWILDQMAGSYEATGLTRFRFQKYAYQGPRDARYLVDPPPMSDAAGKVWRRAPGPGSTLRVSAVPKLHLYDNADCVFRLELRAVQVVEFKPLKESESEILGDFDEFLST